jgi:hypothetical protein
VREGEGGWGPIAAVSGKGEERLEQIRKRKQGMFLFFPSPQSALPTSQLCKNGRKINDLVKHVERLD